ncbi:MAG: alkaline phosphatase family protein [Halobacteriota archaeon]
MPNTVVIGLDGATWRLLEPWIDSGELPALARIRDRGVYGDLESVLPPVTSPNWKAYSTGKNPGKLGVFWWQNVDVKNRRIHLPIERYHENTEYWELLDASGFDVGVINVPTTYPPKSTGEFLLSGPPDSANTGYAHPDSLEDRLREEFDYRVTKRGSLSDGDPDAFEDVLDLIDLRFRVGTQLAAEFDLDFLQLTTFYINSLHHHRWNDAYVKRGWKIIDDHIATFIDDETRNVVLMSDHGHAKIETVFYVNEWLAENGHIAYDEQLPERLHDVGITSDRLKRLLTRLDRQVAGADLRSWAENVTPQWFLDRLPDEEGTLGGSKHGIVDWDRTSALASAQGPVYLTIDSDAPRYESLRSDLVSAFESLRGPDGRPIARAVYHGEEVYEGPYMDEAPDIVIDKAPHVNVRETLGGGTIFSTTDNAWAGVNRREGIFAGYGPAFTRGRVEGLSILDLAPTLLHLHGVAVPSDMDGRVRRDVFADGTRPRDRPPSYRGDESASPADG